VSREQRVESGAPKGRSGFREDISLKSCCGAAGSGCGACGLGVCASAPLAAPARNRHMRIRRIAALATDRDARSSTAVAAKSRRLVGRVGRFRHRG
jgi:hypothetical protein